MKVNLVLAIEMQMFGEKDFFFEPQRAQRTQS